MNLDELISEDGPIKNIERQEGKVIVSLRGEIDLKSSPDVRVAMKEILASKPMEVIIDLEDVGYMDSSGVATLVEALQQIKKYEGKLILRKLQPRVKSIFEIARLTEIFDISDD